MTRTTEQQLENARKAIDNIRAFCDGEISLVELEDLIAQFRRLDAKERNQAEAGHLGAEHGKKGGRPKKQESA